MLPEHVVAWVRDVFRSVNERVSFKVCRIPTGHEVELDATFVEEVSEHAYPVQLEGGWMVRLETHFLGGMRPYFYEERRWEIADIGVLVHFRERGRLVRTKVAAMQSKRLYPNEQHVDEHDIDDYRIGFARLFRDEPQTASQLEPRTFSLDEHSRYKALSIADGQYRAIADYEQRTRLPIHYLFYNPAQLPWSTTLPTTATMTRPDRITVGCRVVPAAVLRAACASMSQDHNPSYHEIRTNLPTEIEPAGWQLEHFIADRLLQCREGHIVEGQGADDTVRALFYRRSGPISAAFSITIDGPLSPGADPGM